MMTSSRLMMRRIVAYQRKDSNLSVSSSNQTTISPIPSSINQLLTAATASSNQSASINRSFSGDTGVSNLRASSEKGRDSGKASAIYNFVPEPLPRNLTNPSLYRGRSNKPIPLELSQPERWQRAAQFMGLSLSIVFGIYGVLFADFGKDDRRNCFTSIRSWFEPYKSFILGKGSTKDS